MLSTVDMVVQRRDGPRRPRDDDVDDATNASNDYVRHADAVNRLARRAGQECVDCRPGRRAARAAGDAASCGRGAGAAPRRCSVRYSATARSAHLPAPTTTAGTCGRCGVPAAAAAPGRAPTGTSAGRRGQSAPHMTAACAPDSPATRTRVTVYYHRGTARRAMSRQLLYEKS